MMLVVAAMKEELRVATGLFPPGLAKGPLGSLGPVCSRLGEEIRFARLGIGPRRSAGRLDALLDALHPDRVLCAGYAGALDPSIRAGELFMVSRAIELDDGAARGLPFEALSARAAFELSGSKALTESASQLTVGVRSGATLTSPGLIGESEQKLSLFRRFGAGVVDMETAALARVCEMRRVPLLCVRAVSDESADGFLAPLRYDPHTGSIRQVAELLAAGNWTRRLKIWRKRSAEARASLRAFLSAYLQGLES